MTTRPPLASRRNALLLTLLVAAALFLPALGARDLWNPNEPLYGRVVVEMTERGDWLLPTFNGEPFPEKPILYYWLALVASAVYGSVDEWTLRLPSALAALGGVAMLVELVRPLAGNRRAALAGVLFTTTFVVWWTARAVQMDLLVTVTTLGAVLAGTRAMEHGRVTSWVLCGVAVGSGVLAKGPVGLICPLLVLVCFAWIVRAPLRLGGAWIAAISAVATCLPWFGWLAVRGEWGFLHELLVRQNVTRFLDPWDHARPWWYYGVYLWIDMAPWFLLAPLAAGLPDRSPGERRLDRLAWVWIVAIVLFFSLSASKRSVYVLPVAPAVAILAAGPIEQWLDGRLSPIRGRLLLAVISAWAGLLAALSVFVVVYEGHAEIRGPLSALALVAAAGAVAVATSVVLSARWRWLAPCVMGSTLLAVYGIAGLWLLPEIDRYKSARPFCEQLVTVVPSDAPLRSYGGWRLRAGYVYYADRVIPVLATDRDLERYWRRTDPVFLVVEDDALDAARRVIGPVAPVLERAVGSKTVYLLTNRPSSSRASRRVRSRRSRAAWP